MKKIFLLFLIFSLGLFQAQYDSNRFTEAESQEAVSTQSTQNGDGTGNPPGCPPEFPDCDPLPAPIDDYIPLLLITATGLILFNAKRQQHLKPSPKRF